MTEKINYPPMSLLTISDDIEVGLQKLLCPFCSSGSGRLISIRTAPIQKSMDVEISEHGIYVQHSDLPEQTGIMVDITLTANCKHTWVHRFSNGKDGVYISTMLDSDSEESSLIPNTMIRL